MRVQRFFVREAIPDESYKKVVEECSSRVKKKTPGEEKGIKYLRIRMTNAVSPAAQMGSLRPLADWLGKVLF